MNTLSVNKTLILTYFAGQASPLQKRLIKEWLAREENQELYFQWLVEWQTSSPHYTADSEDRFQAFADFMKTSTQLPLITNIESEAVKGNTVPLPGNLFGTKWMLAACFLLTLCIGSWYGRENIYYKTYKTAYGEMQTVTLEDGTKVILNANTSMIVPRFGFGDKIREVSLDGEAFFVVKHTKDDKKFLVKTKENFNVLVLGTEFSVYTRSKKSRILLSKGKVQLNISEGNTVKKLIMKPGDMVTMDMKNKPVLKPNTDTRKLIAWTNNRFVFDKTPLSEVTGQIHDHFGIKVEIQDSLFASRKVSGTFQPESAEELLGILAEMFDFKTERQGESILIMKK